MIGTHTLAVPNTPSRSCLFSPSGLASVASSAEVLIQAPTGKVVVSPLVACVTVTWGQRSGRQRQAAHGEQRGGGGEGMGGRAAGKGSEGGAGS